MFCAIFKLFCILQNVSMSLFCQASKKNKFEMSNSCDVTPRGAKNGFHYNGEPVNDQTILTQINQT